jgi:hypothetical protein
MALSMDEQRMLAEIEARLSAEDPGLAVRLSSFRRSSPAAKLRSPRGRVVGSLFAVALAVVISLMVYAMIPFRATAPGKGVTRPIASGKPSAAAPVRPGAKPAASAKASGSATPRAGTSASASGPAAATSGGATKGKTSTAKTGTSAAKTNTSASSSNS